MEDNWGICEQRDGCSKKQSGEMDGQRGGGKDINRGDFNARTGKEGGGCEGEEERIRVRRSKDETINGEGRKLIKFLEENGWGIFNGCTRGDEEGEYSFTGGKGNTVIDYVIGDLEVRDRIGSMKIEGRVDSDHHPVEVWIEDREDREIRKKKGKREWRGVWDE